MPPYKGLKRIRTYCMAYGCLSTDRNRCGTSFFKMPADIERAKEWLVLLDREDLLARESFKPESYYVCSKHFEDHSFKIVRLLNKDATPLKNTNKLEEKLQAGSYTPDEEAVPPPFPKLENGFTLNQPQMIGISTQTEPAKRPDKTTQVNYAMLIPKPTLQAIRLKEKLRESDIERRRLERELKKIQKELERKNTSVAAQKDDEVGARFHKLIEWQNKLKDGSRGNRFDYEYKIFALNLFYASPKAYRSLRTMLKLPSPATIGRFKIDISQKFDDRLIKSLQQKLKSLPDSAKYCSICIYEVPLTSTSQYDPEADETMEPTDGSETVSHDIVSYAYTITLQGIDVNWKQPIAYIILPFKRLYEELDSWLGEVITRFTAIGVNIKAVISDQGSNFDKFAKTVKHISVEKPYFMYDDKKIYYIFDMPHLMKSIRDDLMSNDFYYNGSIISWEFIKVLYNDQKSKNFRLIPKFTPSHLNPNEFKRTKVKYAVQVFSRSVAAALYTYIDMDIIPHDAKPTALFLETMNDLFDVLNSSKTKCLNKFKVAYKNAPHQEKALDDAATMLSGISGIDKETGVDDAAIDKSLINVQITIRAIRMLFEDMKNEGFKHILTRQLNQECLETFFSAIRQPGEKIRNPTLTQFKRAFSKLFICNMLKSSPTANCGTDMYDILLQAEDIMETITS